MADSTLSARRSIPDESIDALVAVLDAVRSGSARTRPEIIRHTELGRSVVVQRVDELVARGVLLEAGLGPSSGGRAPRTLQLNPAAGHTLVADLGATSIAVALTDITGRLLHEHEERADITVGPEALLGRVDQLFAELLSRAEGHVGDLWGIGIGIPGPVEFATGRPVAPPIMPNWDGYPVRERFSDRYGVPVWVDNDVNVMALGEHRAGAARGHDTAIFVKVGTGIGAGIIVDGKLHRGAQGSAGDVGHIQITDDPSRVCRCGNVGCLEAFAGGAALARDGMLAAAQGRSPLLSALLEERGAIEASDVANAAARGDAASRELIVTAGRRIGIVVATLVNALNPSLIIIGGGVSRAGDMLIATVRETVYGRSLPLATRDLQIVRSSLDAEAGRMGAASLVVDQLFSRPFLGTWLSAGSPAALV